MADTLLTQLEAAMENLIDVITLESELVEKGKLLEAGRLQPEKTMRSRAYMAIIDHIKKQDGSLAEQDPALAQKLRDRHETFQGLVKTNLHALSVARDVTKNILKTVSRRVGQMEAPKTYGYQGTTNHQKVPIGYGLTVDRNL